MQALYRKLERLFEHLSQTGTRWLGNSIIFMAGISLVIFWLVVRDWSKQNLTDTIRDLILAITFLGFFIIQRWFNKFSQVINLKLNELIAAHEKARDRLVKSEEKTEDELKELAKAHEELAAKTIEDKINSGESGTHK